MKTWTWIAVSRPYVPGLLLVLSLAVCAQASSLVNATDNIYGAGLASAPGGGTVPGSLSVLGQTSITFSSISGSLTAGCASAEGCITISGGGSFNDPDGVGNPQPTFTSPGTAVLSGITAPNAGFLLGVFAPAGGPAGAAPASLVFTTTTFTTLSPLLDQVFFIGDGLTGDGTGTVQQFNVPTSAASLYLGIVDLGGAYGDNSGTYTVNFSLTTTSAPEPGSWLQAAAGLFALAIIGRQAKSRLRA